MTRHIFTAEERARGGNHTRNRPHLKQYQFKPGDDPKRCIWDNQQRAQAGAKHEIVQAKLTPEQRTLKAKHMSMSLTPEQRSERSRLAGVAAWNGARMDQKQRDREDFLRYGLQPGEREQLEQAQNGKCAICGRPPVKVRLHVDHHHQCGRYEKWRRLSVRGMLCNTCNRGLLRENPALLRKAADYFQAHLEVCPARLKEAERAAA